MKKLKHIHMPNTLTDMLVKNQKHANAAFFFEKKNYASPANNSAQNCGWFTVIDFTSFNYRSRGRNPTPRIAHVSQSSQHRD